MIPFAGCVTSAKYNMRALILPQTAGSYTPPAEDGEEGHWETVQNPITGQIERVWVDAPVDDNPDTPGDESLTGARYISCQANAIITGGLNSQGTTERWTSKGEYQNVDFVEMRVSANTLIRRRDRVTNITGPNGDILWIEEDHPADDGTLPPTVFQVRGVAPSLDIFNRPIEQFILLERAENQELQYG